MDVTSTAQDPSEPRPALLPARPALEALEMRHLRISRHPGEAIEIHVLRTAQAQPGSMDRDPSEV
jgi:hypothetical protein